MKITKSYIEKKLKYIQKSHNKLVKNRGVSYDDRKDGRHWLVAAYRPTKGLFRISNNCDLYIHEDGTIDGRFYKWWSTVKTVKNKVVFNKHKYSVTTRKHQSDIRITLNLLGIKIDHEVSVHDGLQYHDMNQALRNYTYEISLKNAYQNDPKSKKDISESIKSLTKEMNLFMRLFNVKKLKGTEKKELELKAKKSHLDKKEREKENRQKRKEYKLSLIPAKFKTELGKVMYD